MAGERARQIRRAGQDATTEAMRAVEENGELAHLYGQRLDLSDNSPDWFVHRLLKREGLSLPAIEQGRDLDAAARVADGIVERLRRRRAWLARPESGCTVEQAHSFNEARDRALEEYRAALTDLNRATLSYNLTAPAPLHRHGVRVDEAVEAVAREILPLDVPGAAPGVQPWARQRPSSLRWRAPWRRWRAGQ